MTAGLIIVGIIGLVLIVFAVIGVQSRSGVSPGLDGKRLSACSARPNCVGSEYPDDKEHFIAPLSFTKSQSEAARTALIEIIGDMGGDLITDEGGYLAATFKSRVFGFVDDLELRITDDIQLIQVRSASRVGYSDRGVNRRRVERLRALYKSRMTQTN